MHEAVYEIILLRFSSNTVIVAMRLESEHVFDMI